MTSKTRRLAFTAGFVVLVALTLWSWIPGAAAPGETAKAAASEKALQEPASFDSHPAPAPEAPSSAQLPAQPKGSARQSYAFGLHDLAGLPQDTPPGTVVDLWVAWDPPITEEPQFQRLISSVIVEEIQAPFVPEGPVTVILSVQAKRIGDLLYADRYGAVSVTLPTS